MYDGGNLWKQILLFEEFKIHVYSILRHFQSLNIIIILRKIIVFVRKLFLNCWETASHNPAGVTSFIALPTIYTPVMEHPNNQTLIYADNKIL